MQKKIKKYKSNKLNKWYIQVEVLKADATITDIWLIITWLLKIIFTI